MSRVSLYFRFASLARCLLLLRGRLRLGSLKEKLIRSRVGRLGETVTSVRRNSAHHPAGSGLRGYESGVAALCHHAGWQALDFGEFPSIQSFVFLIGRGI